MFDFSKMGAAILGLVVGILVLMVCICSLKNTPVASQCEAFGQVVGAASPFRTSYIDCLANCEKTDPTNRLSQNPWACGMYCDDIVAQSVAQGRNLGAFVPDSALCSEQCSGAPDELACRASCMCARNVQEFCAQQCDHSSSPVCFSNCQEIYKTRCFAGNSWFFRTIT